MFVYGSLLFSFVWKHVIGREPKMRSAKVYGFRRYAVRDSFYPGVWHEEKGVLSGKFVLDLTADEIAMVDEYEGGEYQKSTVQVILEDGMVMGVLYLRPPEDEEEWDRVWSEEDLSREGFLRCIHD